MLTVKIIWDDEAKVYYAVCEEIGLALESESYNHLLERLKVAVPEMAEENKVSYTEISINTNTYNLSNL